jgi:hypothetical protein
MAGARRPAREEEENEPGRERVEGKRGRAAWRAGGCSRGVFSAFSGKQDVASSSPAQDTHVCCLLEEEGRNFAENPLGFGRFQGKK